MRQLSIVIGLIVSLAGLILLESGGSSQALIKTVAITQIVAHPSLDEARQGILDALKSAGYIPEKSIHIIYENAQGNTQLATQIAHKLIEKHPNVLVPISTSSTQSIVKANKNNIPVVFSTVTDPIASGIVKSLNHPGVEITGAMERPPIEKQIALLRQIVPHVRRIGVIYSAAEMNSVATVKRLKALQNLVVIERPINSSLDLKSAALSLIHKVDAIYLPSDNTVWSGLSAVIKITEKANIPVLTGDPASINKGVLIALGYSQYDIGQTAGKLIVRVLNGQSASQLPIQKPASTTLALNLCAAKKIHLTIPKEVIQHAKQRVTECH